MSAIFGEKLTLSQENGPDVCLVVYGDEFYARYETPEGYSVVYDPGLGVFCYAFLRNGALESSGVSTAQAPPTEAVLHGRESPAVRRAKIARRTASLRTRTGGQG